ncbi:LamB/YcsF family protein [Cellulomonas fimi]|uniref:LamB/YcsF family protein n=1 Tax=Cellulomonas fimi TaxID=1708 RepID=UPI00234DB7BB|nr:5-oxoprolinase subunit PxpA [Cellulomonas fimi]MDC7123450.1 LamB/YcsF family protein [Cellulomonas fimi]
MGARIDLNCDLGEGLDDWVPGVAGPESRLLDVVTSANVACGFHAGDDRVMAAVCRAAAERGVAVGAQVSYRDREGFGRRFLDVPPDVLRADVVEQVRALRRAAAASGAQVAYVKPHGALYNAVVHHAEQAAAVVDAVVEASGSGGPLPLVGLPGAVVLDVARDRGLRPVREAFADRGYRADGTLVPRTEPGALVVDPDDVVARVLGMARDGRVTSVDGTVIPVDAESVCVHSDTPGAVTLAVAVRRALDEAGVAVGPFV